MRCANLECSALAMAAGAMIESADGRQLIPVEAKLTATPRPEHAQAIERFQALFGDRAGRGLLVCLCRERFRLTSSVEAVPLDAI